MTLGERQELFTNTLWKLLARMNTLGFQARLKEVLRPDLIALVYGYDEAKCLKAANLLQPEFPDMANAIHRISKVNGSTRSVHLEALAADIDLFRNGVYLSSGVEHADFGKWWEAQHPLCCWGGRFGDPNHYSVTPDGVRK